MSIRAVLVGSIVVVGFSTRGHGQTVVQLPTFHQFTVSTTVVVPDSGAGFAAGIGRSASGSSRRGLLGLGMPGVRPSNNRAAGRADAGGGVVVQAQIHDHHAMDQHLLGQAASNRPLSRSRAGLNPLLAGPGSSLTEIRKGRADRELVTSADGRALLARGREAEAARKVSVARQYYQMAAKASR